MVGFSVSDATALISCAGAGKAHLLATVPLVPVETGLSDSGGPFEGTTPKAVGEDHAFIFSHGGIVVIDLQLQVMIFCFVATAVSNGQHITTDTELECFAIRVNGGPGPSSIDAGNRAGITVAICSLHISCHQQQYCDS